MTKGETKTFTDELIFELSANKLYTIVFFARLANTTAGYDVEYDVYKPAMANAIEKVDSSDMRITVEHLDFNAYVMKLYNDAKNDKKCTADYITRTSCEVLVKDYIGGGWPCQSQYQLKPVDSCGPGDIFFSRARNSTEGVSVKEEASEERPNTKKKGNWST